MSRSVPVPDLRDLLAEMRRRQDATDLKLKELAEEMAALKERRRPATRNLDETGGKILEFMKQFPGMWMLPPMIASNLGVEPEEVRNRLTTMAANKWISTGRPVGKVPQYRFVPEG